MEEYLQEALEIAKAQASVRNMTEDEISFMVATVAKKVKEISEEAGQQQQEQPQEQQQQEPAVDPKKSIREKSVVCLECGKTFKVLTKRHLETHGITPQQYKEKWGFKKNQALIAKSLARKEERKCRKCSFGREGRILNKQSNKSLRQKGTKICMHLLLMEVLDRRETPIIY